MAQGKPELGYSFVLRMRYEGTTAEKIGRSANPQTLKNIFTKSVAKHLKLLKISLPKQSNVRISQAVQEALELTYDVKKTAQVLERNLKTHVESATPDQLNACSLISLELFQFQFNSVAGPLQPSDVPFLWTFANPTLLHGGGPGYLTATEASYAMMQASNQLSLRELWPSDAPPSSSLDITTPSASSTSSTFLTGSTFPHPSLPPRPSATHDSSPKAPQAGNRSHVAMSSSGSGSIQLDGRERSKKKSGSNAIPLGRRNEGQLLAFVRQTDTYEHPPGYASESATPLQNPIQESYPSGSSSFSPPTQSDDYRTELFRLRSQVEAQNEAIRGYKRTVKAMMDGETEVQREIKRLRMANEQALEVVMKMQEDAVQDERQDNVKSECDLLTALQVVGRHIDILKNSRDQERRGRQMMEEQLLEERQSRAKDMVNIERECRDPFVVPALLQAFLKMSEMTDTILE